MAGTVEVDNRLISIARLIVNWCFRNRKCFTRRFRAQYRLTRREVHPVLSRVQNIGYEMGDGLISRICLATHARGSLVPVVLRRSLAT